MPISIHKSNMQVLSYPISIQEESGYETRLLELLLGHQLFQRSQVCLHVPQLNSGSPESLCQILGGRFQPNSQVPILNLNPDSTALSFLFPIVYSTASFSKFQIKKFLMRKRPLCFDVLAKVLSVKGVRSDSPPRVDGGFMQGIVVFLLFGGCPLVDGKTNFFVTHLLLI